MISLRRKRLRVAFSVALAASLWVTSAGCAARPKTPLRVFFAGSLIIPFDALEKAYEAKHPDVDVQMEGHGSIQVIRHVTEIHELIDVVVTADHALIPALMYGSRVPETGQPYASWHIAFATNRLALAYTPKSKHADEINAGNWYELIARPGVKVGIADPRFDAAGYRALMALQLAEASYDDPLVFENLIMGRFKSSITTQEGNGRVVIHVPEIVEAKRDSGIIIRGASIQLIALLESGDLDYAFEYESVIRQHGLELLSLPDAINLGSEQYADRYHQVQVRLDFQRFASVKPEFDGELIGYGVTIPSNAPQPRQAEAFVAFLLGPEGHSILETHQHPPIAPPQADRHDAVPETLKPLCVPMPSQ
ncbi:MAG: tungstate ABC transporter substrate-binding protein WtpA [Thermoflexales bacterium]|nr:tungstate ABC transporter substrate-binding protein WtpA [Thermoflexales bacterium]